MEKNYLEAIKLFDKSIKIKPDFWQAINNQGLAYFERNNVNLSIKLFESAISIEENACLLYTSPSPRDKRQSRMPSSA